jgi:hypothetical protein
VQEDECNTAANSTPAFCGISCIQQRSSGRKLRETGLEANTKNGSGFTTQPDSRRKGGAARSQAASQLEASIDIITMVRLSNGDNPGT